MRRRPEKQPWGKFYWADWLSDPKLKLCSLGAQGLWMRMLCIAAEAKPTGYVVLEGNALGAIELAGECGKPVKEVAAALAELQRWGVFSTDRRGRIYSRRMIDDLKKAKTARENGRNGGNPALGKRSGNSAWDNRGDKPQRPEARVRARNTPQPPKGGFVDLPDWNGPDEVRAVIRKHLGDDADGHLRSCGWRDVPERALVARSSTMLAKLKSCAAELEAAGVRLILEKGRAA
jgi:hypothetical protein